MNETRLMTRRAAAQYMGRCVKTFDRIRHLFETEDDGLIRYDKALMDTYIALHRAEAA